MKRIVLLSCTVITFLFASLSSSADEGISPEEGCAVMQLMLLAEDVTATCVYKAVDGFGNTWLVEVHQSSKTKYEALGYILLYAENFDRQIPSRTDYILARIGGTIFSAPMAETRSCLKGVGLKGLGCVAPHIREG